MWGCGHRHQPPSFLSSLSGCNNEIAEISSDVPSEPVASVSDAEISSLHMMTLTIHDAVISAAALRDDSRDEEDTYI